MDSAINMEAFRNNDEGEFEKIFTMLIGPLNYFAKNIIGNEQEAEDIVIDSFMKLYPKRGDFDKQEQVRSFLYITVRNRCLNYLRHKNVHSKYVQEHKHLSKEDQDPMANMQSIETDVLKKVLHEIESLPETCRGIFKLHVEGKSNAEIAEIVKKEYSNVTTQLSLAYKNLRKKMKNFPF